MPVFDLPLPELERYLPEPDEPDDFDDFWVSTLADARPPLAPSLTTAIARGLLA